VVWEDGGGDPASYPIATRAAGVPRAFEHPAATPTTPPGNAPLRRTEAGSRQAWLRWVLECSAVPDASGRRLRATGLAPAGRSPCPSTSTPLMTILRAATMRRRVPSRCRRSIALAFGCGPIRAGKLLSRRVPVRMRRFAKAGLHPRPCIGRESWRGHGAPSLRSVRLGLVRRNRPARQISPPLRGFLARQISRSFRSSALLRPAVRRARLLA